MNAILQGEHFMAVDDNRGERKVVQGRRVRHYHYQPMLEPVTRVDVLADALPVIEAHIRLTRRKRTCGSFVFITPERDVFVLSEESNIAADWVLTKLPWLVGLYCQKKVKLQAPYCLGEVVELDLEGLEGDIAEHLAQLVPQ